MEAYVRAMASPFDPEWLMPEAAPADGATGGDHSVADDSGEGDGREPSDTGPEVGADGPAAAGELATAEEALLYELNPDIDIFNLSA